MALRVNIRRINGCLLLGLWLAGCQVFPGQRADPLVASGVVETVEIVIVSETGGTVTEVNFEEGQNVTSGDVLLRLDDRTLQVQTQQAQAALASAKANYNLVAANALAIKAQQEAAVAAAQLELTAAQNALSDLYDSATVTAAQAKLDLANARDQLDDAEYHWRVQQPGYRANSDTINAAQANLTLAEKEVDQAQRDFNKVSSRAEDDPARAFALSNLSAARQQRDAILRQLNWYLGKPDEIEQAILDAEVTYAEALMEKASHDWEILQDGPDPEDLALLEDRVANAQAQLAAARSGVPVDEQVEVAQALVDAAQADLAMLAVQLDKTVIRSPLTGVVMTRIIEPGEVLVPGAVAFTISGLDRMHLTVYVPEDRYGQISLGDTAAVTVDSFPDNRFSATVIRIANRAEYTPRNVQTSEDRQTTVYAIDLAVTDPDGKLKPGMPADIAFGY